MRLRWKLAVATCLIAVAAFVAFGELPEIDLERALEDLSRRLGSWTYLFVGVMAFLETGAFVGLVAPGEISVILGGAVAGQGEVDIFLLIAIAWLGALLGDSVSFMLGRKLGRGFVLDHGPRVRITRERFAHVEAYFERHGGKTIVIGRALGVVRTLAPFIAGTSAMRYAVFLPFSVLGTGIWASAAALLGYVFSRNVDRAADLAGAGSVLFGTLVAIVVAIIMIRRITATEESRAKAAGYMEQHRSLRWLLRLLRRAEPQLRFTWNRLTPGGLGLEFTSLLAVLSVAGYALVASLSVVGGDRGPTGGDLRALRLVEGLRVEWLSEVARVASLAGDPLPAALLAAAGGLWLASQRRWSEICVLAAGAVAVFAGSEILRGLYERPGPLGGIADSERSSFPSPQAAHATLYAWFAVTLAFRVIPGMASRGLVVGVGFAAAAAIGLSRVYLGAQWVSDVVAGWALGAASFTLAAVVALAFEHRRNAARRRAVRQNREGASAGRLP